MIPYGRHNITSDDVDQVIEVLKSEWLTQGPTVGRFERAVAERVGAKHAVAMNSGTSALHIACLALDLQPGDCLWTSPNTFVASANCALYCGAQVDFVDIDARTYNMCANALAEKLEQAEKNGRLPKIVVPVHFAGQSCDMESIQKLARKYGFKIIEDASHAVGGSYRNVPIGRCDHSDVTVFSFHPVKIITSGEGGMALTNSRELALRMERLRTHGITRDPEQMIGIPEGPWYYEQLDLGLNYRMTDIHAALGLGQQRRLDELVLVRRQLAVAYDEALAKLPVIRPFQSADTTSAFHLYVIKIDPNKTRSSRRTVFDRLRAAGIGVNVHYIPVHIQPYYQRRGFHVGQFPEAERYYKSAITLPLYAGLRASEQASIVKALVNALKD